MEDGRWKMLPLATMAAPGKTHLGTTLACDFRCAADKTKIIRSHTNACYNLACVGSRLVSRVIGL